MPLAPFSDFQLAVRSLAKEQVPSDYKGMFAVDPEEHGQAIEVNRRFSRCLAERGLLASAWPREYGGQELPFLRQMELAEEMAYFLEPRGAFYMGVNWIGPTLIRSGSDEQRHRHLPAIAYANVVWCQGFSEPNAGSDLSSLTTPAVRKDGGYVVNGQKIWVSFADYADWCILATRTKRGERPQEGISLFLVPMDSPGITVRPILASFGQHFNEIFFDNLFIRGENLVGEEGGGWRIMTGGLELERIGNLWYAECKRVLDEVIPHLSFLRGDTRRTARLALAQIEVEILAARCMARRVYEGMDQGTLAGHECSALKIYMAELYERTAMTVRSLMGDVACLHSSAGHVPINGHLDRLVRFCKEPAIGAGTNEIQRNIIAQRGLGLPRENSRRSA